MSHRQSTIPFSWEMIPGVPKVMASPAAEVCLQKKPLAPPPPGCFRKRSASSKTWREVDPFVAAFKECSKDETKKRFKVWGSKSFLWCRCSFDVEEGRTRPLPSSGERVEGLISMQNGGKKTVNYQCKID